MDTVFIFPILTSVLFFLIKLAEIRYFGGGDGVGDDGKKPLKFIVRDTIMVFVSSLVVSYLMEYMNTYIADFFNVITDNKVVPTAVNTQIFTDQPNF
jgi:hypothetical protein